MSFSVNTNVGAMAALQTLSATNRDLSITQSRVNTGLNVASTKDDSAAFTIAQTLRGDLGGLTAVRSSLSTAKSVVDVAVAGAEQISNLVNQMKAKAIQASDAGISTDSRAAIAKDFDALKSQINTIIASSTFNGTNLLKGGTAANGSTAAVPDGGSVNALQSTDVNAGNLSVANQDFTAIVVGTAGTAATAGTPAVADDPATTGVDESAPATTGTPATSGTGIGATFTDAASAKEMVSRLEGVTKTINAKLSTLGSASRQVDGQSSFVSKLSDVIEGGIGNLVDADYAKESAKLQALQVKQQLGIQALSIANQAPQSILSLFR